MSDLTIEEQQNAVRTKKVVENAVSMSNIVELATGVMVLLAGKDTADAVNGQPVTRAVVGNIVANRIKEKWLK